MKHYMLDTNTVSYLMKGHTEVSRRIMNIPMSSLCISSLTEGELIFGLAKRPMAKMLHKIVREFLLRVDVLPWDSKVAETYGYLRAEMENKGITLGHLDMLIAAHALQAKNVLVTADKAFRHISHLSIEDWTTPEL